MPSFAIEAQGETNPLTSEQVYKCLIQASVGDQQGVRVATEQLHNWEKQSGYFSILQDVYSDLSIDQNVRFQAIIQLKNGIDKYWRKTASYAIGKSEKVKIRTKAFEIGVVEPVMPLGLQNALMIAKIFRYEFPSGWPDAMSQIIDRLQPTAANAQEQMNILLIGLQVIKELASGKLPRTRKGLQQVGLELLEAFKTSYHDCFRRWTDGRDTTNAELVLLVLRCIRRLLVAGFDHPHRDERVKQVWSELRGDYDRLWTLLHNGTSSEDLQKQLAQHTKLQLDMARTHPASFVMLPGATKTLELAWSQIAAYGSARNEDDVFREKTALRSLLLLRAAVKMVFNPAQTFRYQTQQDKDERKQAVAFVKSEMLQDATVIAMAEVLIRVYLRLTDHDITEWQEDPEQFERQEEESADAWESTVRPCAEKLLLDLVINFKSLLIPKLVQILNHSGEMNAMQKESVYSAIGIAAPCMENALDFNGLLARLVQEAQSNEPILQRRIPILLGQLVPIKPDGIDRQAVYGVLTLLMSPQNDLVIRITAARSLRPVLEPFEFAFDDFRPWAADIFSHLLGLTLETESTETKLTVLETLRLAILKIEMNAQLYAEAVLSMLSNIWISNPEDHLLQQAILTIITALVTSLRSPAYSSVVIPLIRGSLKGEAKLYLLDEALDLWTELVRFTVEPGADILAMFGDLLQLLESGSDSTSQSFDLVQSYILLSPATVLRDCRALLAVLSPLLDGLGRVRDAAIAPEIVETLVPHSPQHVVATMLDSEFATKMLILINSAYDYHRKPSGRPPDVVGPAETKLFNILARVAIADSALFRQLFGAIAVIEEWLESFDAIGDVTQKKLQALGMTSLVEFMLAPRLFQRLLSIWTDILTELGLDTPSGDYLWQGETPAPVPQDETPEERRKRISTEKDPVYTINLKVYVKGAFEAVMSDEFSARVLNQIDQDVLKGFGELGVV